MTPIQATVPFNKGTRTSPLPSPAESFPNSSVLSPSTTLLTKSAFDSVRPRRGSGAKDGSITEFLAGVLEPFAVLMSAVLAFSSMQDRVRVSLDGVYLWVLRMGRVVGI